MKDQVTQDCPLCRTAAVFYLVDHGQTKYFHCPHCKYFQITPRAESLLAEAPQGVRDELAGQAKQTPDDDHLLVIRVLPRSQQDEGRAQTLSATFVPKSQLSL